MTGREFFARVGDKVDTTANIIAILPKSFRLWLYNRVKNIGGKTGILFRYILIKHLAKKCKKNVCISQYVVIKHIEELQLGENVSIHEFCYIDAIGGISIGDNVSIAHNCSLISFNHTYSQPDKPIKYNPIIAAPITIGDDVWIGCCCRLLSGVVIGKRVVIAAGAIVNKDVKGNELVGGVPAKHIRDI